MKTAKQNPKKNVAAALCLLLWAVFAICPPPAAARHNACPPQRKPMTAEQYVKLYAKEAQRQQRKYGVPASITLAQGMHESAFGSSYLAVVANNHFGIKAYSRGWKGKVVHCDDDARQEPFCKFSSVAEGFEYHSTFLRDSPRYASLFKLDVEDYEGWAKGLKKCGYATNPKYAALLIDLIEKHHLDYYDVPSKRYIDSPHRLYQTAKGRKGLKYVRAHADDDLSYIAREFDVSRRQLRRWNDLPRKHTLREGEIIYLEAKRRRADKAHPTHTVRAGESLRSVAQTYGVTVSSVVKRNGLTTAQVRTGQVLKLR